MRCSPTWPIVDDRKLVLPHLSRFVRTQRTATAATIRIGEKLVQLYSTHLGTMGDLAPADRRDQLGAILTDAKRYSLVVIGGDMNDAGVGPAGPGQRLRLAHTTRTGHHTTRPAGSHLLQGSRYSSAEDIRHRPRRARRE